MIYSDFNRLEMVDLIYENIVVFVQFETNQILFFKHPFYLQ